MATDFARNLMVFPANELVHAGPTPILYYRARVLLKKTNEPLSSKCFSLHNRLYDWVFVDIVLKF